MMAPSIVAAATASFGRLILGGLINEYRHAA
jgi:hypothetical protein